MIEIIKADASRYESGANEFPNLSEIVPSKNSVAAEETLDKIVLSFRWINPKVNNIITVNNAKPIDEFDHATGFNKLLTISCIIAVIINMLKYAKARFFNVVIDLGVVLIK